jgi:hypothetical protein
MVKFKLYRLIILTSVLFFCCCSIWAQSSQENDSTYLKKAFPKQESRSSLVFSGSFLHFQGKQDNLAVSYVRGITDYYLFPLNAGFGIFYQYQIYKKNYLLSGINYQMCHIASTESGIMRFRYREPSISVYFKHYFLKNEKIGLFSTIGLSFGRIKLLASESYGHITWSNFETKYLQNYSNNNTFVDLIFNAGVSLPASHIEIAPALGYRVKDNWMAYCRHQFFYGLTINYQLEFSKK